MREGGLNGFAIKLHARQDVSRGQFYSGYGILISAGGYGAFDEIGTGFAGFKFDHGTQYGWVRIKILKSRP